MDLSKNNIKKLIGIICVCILFYWALNHPELLKEGMSFLLNLMMPFLAGCTMAFIINVLMRPIENGLKRVGGKEKSYLMKHERIARTLALLLSLLILVLALLLVFSIVLPELYRTFHQLFRQIPIALNSFYQWISTIYIPGSVLEDAITYLNSLDWVAISKQAMTIAKDVLSGIAFSGIGVLGAVASLFTSLGIGFIFAIYLLVQKEQLAGQGRQLLYAFLSRKQAGRIIYILRLTNRTFSSFVRGQCLEAFILSCMFFVTMTLFRMPYTLLVSVVICVTALIPILGSFIGCAVGIFLIALVSPVQALLFLVLFLVLQQIEGNLIYPHVVGNSIGLPGIWVLVAVTVGGGLMGIAGMLLFIPACSVLYSLLKENAKRRLKERKITEQELKGEE